MGLVGVCNTSHIERKSSSTRYRQTIKKRPLFVNTHFGSSIPVLLAVYVQNLAFSISTERTGMTGDGGKNAFDIPQDRCYFDKTYQVQQKSTCTAQSGTLLLIEQRITAPIIAPQHAQAPLNRQPSNKAQRFVSRQG